MKILLIAFSVSGLLSFAAATSLAVMIAFDHVQYSEARGLYVGMLYFLGAVFMFVTAAALKFQRDGGSA